MKANKDKVYFIISNNEHVSIKIDDNEVKSSDDEKVIGVKIDSKLNLKDHLDGVIKKARRKVSVLSPIAPYMNIAKRRLLMNLFFVSQFNYCPLIWDLGASYSWSQQQTLTVCMKNVYVLHIVTIDHPANIC